MTDNVQQGATTLLRMRQVKVRTGLSRSTIYLKIKSGRVSRPGLARTARGGLARG